MGVGLYVKKNNHKASNVYQGYYYASILYFYIAKTINIIYFT